MNVCSSALLISNEDEDDQQEEEEEEEEDWDDWVSNDDGDSIAEEFLCLFCPARFASTQLLFQHCTTEHAFDFPKLRADLSLRFYDCICLINFIRSQVACNTCWSCGLVQDSQNALLQHLKSANHNKKVHEGDGKGTCTQFDGSAVQRWKDDKFLTPFLENDALLHGFEDTLDDDDDDDDDDDTKEKLSHEDVKSFFDSDDGKRFISTVVDGMDKESLIMHASDQVEALSVDDSQSNVRGAEQQERSCSSSPINDSVHSLVKKKRNGNLKVSFAEVAARERSSINQTYFGSYSTFGIHREMLSDKIRTDAYEHALTKNPALLVGAVVMDLGCGTGILSLFAAKAGAKKVIGVEGSKRMSLLAQQVVKANGCLNDSMGQSNDDSGKRGTISVVHGMIEELDLASYTPSNGVDVLVSEWMGYCLLFESMLNSVLFARDRWLKPGGAILPDVAEMYVAGFGVGATSLPFWDSVYGFDMKCIGREVLEDAASSLIVDVIDSKDIVTDTCLLQTFDLITMAQHDVDFTSAFELHPQKPNALQDSATSVPKSSATRTPEKGDDKIWCYGLVVWFDTCFSSRFCPENPVRLSTSPYLPKTHWSQTLLTFQQPICVSLMTILNGQDTTVESIEQVGTACSPASAVKGRISIARSSRHRSIDVSLEMVAMGRSGVSRQLPVQMFEM